MRNFLILLSLWLGLTASVFAAETLTLTLTDGGSLTGDIVKADDLGVMIHSTAETYTNIQWSRFSQEALKQLVQNPKTQGYVEPFIAPTEATHPQKADLPIKEVMRLKRPENPSIFGGLLHSSVGLFMLLVIYAANLYAAFQIAMVRGKPLGAVMGLSAVLPVIGPIIFLAQPIKAKPEPEAAAGEAGGATPGPASGLPEDIQIVSASWQGGVPEEKKPQAQIFARGKFTFNKRFVETKFAGFIGEPKGDAKTFTMEVRTLKEQLAVERIMQVAATEVIFETPNGQVTVAFADIQEVKLNPKIA